MQSGQRSCSVFCNDDGFRVLLVPGSYFVDHLECDQLRMACIAVPAVVTVYANDIQELALPFPPPESLKIMLAIIFL